jgi:hypothetical protein
MELCLSGGVGRSATRLGEMGTPRDQRVGKKDTSWDRRRRLSLMRNRHHAVWEMLLHEGVEAYKKEGPKFIQRLVAKQKLRTK